MAVLFILQGSRWQVEDRDQDGEIGPQGSKDNRYQSKVEAMARVVCEAKIQSKIWTFKNSRVIE